jgi:hypothetical protein
MQPPLRKVQAIRRSRIRRSAARRLFLIQNTGGASRKPTTQDDSENFSESKHLLIYSRGFRHFKYDNVLPLSR